MYLLYTSPPRFLSAFTQFILVWLYNRIRIHSTANYSSPENFESLQKIAWKFVQKTVSRSLPYLALLLHWFCEHSYKGGVSFVDSTSLTVCHIKRISAHKVFKGLAAIGKTTKEWFLGLKLDLIINEEGQIQGVQWSAGNVDDRTSVPELTKRLKVFCLQTKAI